MSFQNEKTIFHSKNKASQGKFENFQHEMDKMPQILHYNVLKYIENNWDDLYKQLKDSNNKNGW